MRILCICYEYPPVGGGGASFCEGINEAFVRAGHDVDIVTSGMPDIAARETRNGVGIYRVPCRRRHRRGHRIEPGLLGGEAATLRLIEVLLIAVLALRGIDEQIARQRRRPGQ